MKTSSHESRITQPTEGGPREITPITVPLCGTPGNPGRDPHQLGERPADPARPSPCIDQQNLGQNPSEEITPTGSQFHVEAAVRRGRIKNRGKINVTSDIESLNCRLVVTPSGAKRIRRNAFRLDIPTKGHTLSDTVQAFVVHQIQNGASILTPRPVRRRLKGKRYSVTARAVRGGKAS